ncbi:hypothetical protein CWB57_18435, partial [Pseudoalteromonas sp. S186]
EMHQSNSPLSEKVIRVLLSRISEALKIMVTDSPSSKALKGRLEEMNQHLSIRVQGTISDSMALPSNDNHLVALNQGLKRLRGILLSEHS